MSEQTGTKKKTVGVSLDPYLVEQMDKYAGKEKPFSGNSSMVSAALHRLIRDLERDEEKTKEEIEKAEG